MAVSERHKLLTQAQIADRAHRYEDMINYMKEVIKNESIHTMEDTNVLVLGYKHLVDHLRYSIKVVEDELNKSVGQPNSLIQAYQLAADNYRAELRNKLTEVRNILDGDLTIIHHSYATEVLYLKLKGDFYRYAAELEQGDERTHVGQFGLLAYKEASIIAREQLRPSHPTQLGLALNMATFYHTILNKTDVAVKIVKEAYELAFTDIESISDEMYRDSYTAMQAMRNRIYAWSSLLQPGDGAVSALEMPRLRRGLPRKTIADIILYKRTSVIF